MRKTSFSLLFSALCLEKYSQEINKDALDT